MSRFYASISGSAKNQVTRQGGKKSGITGHIRGWGVGIRINGFVDTNGKDHFCIYRTGGSHNPSTLRLIAEVVSESH